MKAPFLPVVALGGVLLAPALGHAADPRRADVTLELAATRYGEFDETGVGFGARLSYRAIDWLAVDGGLLFAPGDLGKPAFSGAQREGLFGLRAGPRLGRGSVFAAVRSGFVTFSKAPEPLLCIAIFPPPLRCALAGGHTAFAVTLGGGGEIPFGGHGLVRLEAGDLLLKYPGPALTKDGAVLEDSFWRHNLRAALSVGFRF
jgi:hypothetical protein